MISNIINSANKSASKVNVPKLNLSKVVNEFEIQKPAAEKKF